MRRLSSIVCVERCCLLSRLCSSRQPQLWYKHTTAATRVSRQACRIQSRAWTFVHSSPFGISPSMKSLKLLYELERQLKLLPHNSPSGFIVTPDAKALDRWFGVIFVRESIYQGAIFHFSIEFPAKFPEELPRFHFISPVLHPFVHPDSGAVDISGAFDTYDVRITDALAYIKIMLGFPQEGIEEGDVRIVNQEAYAQLKESREEFIKAARDCAMKSAKSPNTPDSAIKFSRPTDMHKTLHEFIVSKEWTGRNFDWAKYFSGLE
ncbi:Ubiquitin-conjugating enzyme [Carpediemonas membranifera]|uniref:Ubiquitin-conjugating enzyme n=1 Tax=Carpediemonas membranifera TaxID=201153 RepID=A0A8J6AZC7_9EUKA|nr:Ubiquitin-conjugating enzyme [Carpediemonas membranifera]|eukprot:KAG9396020.1 Ubiquitin-conjugating enzyme [Carpediemonas membranifera]